MSDLNPTEIYRRYERKELDKAAAVGYLKSIVESSSDEELRVQSVELLGEMNLDTGEIFEFLENLVSIDSSDSLKSAVITMLYRDFREISKKRLLKFFEGGTSPDCLLGVYNALTHKKSENHGELLHFMEEIIGLKRLINYDLIPKEAMALELLGRHLSTIETIYKQKEWIFNTIEIKHNRVFSIDIEMSYNRINSKFLNLFSNLQKLRLFDCELTDYYTLENLTSILITGTEEGHIDSINDLKGLETLINLKDLDLSGNNISEIKNLGKLTNLVKLDLSENDISEIKGLETLKNLEVLNLQHNNIKEIKNLEDLDNLRELNLSDNKDISEIKGLRKLNSLEILRLYNNFLINEIKGLDGLKNLRLLDLSKDSFMVDKEGYEFLLKMRLLFSKNSNFEELVSAENEKFRKKLEKYRHYITEIKGLNTLSNLRNLFLGGNQITEIKGLEESEKLEILDLRSNQITIIKGLENLKKLKTLRLAGNNIIPIEGLEGIENDLGVYNPQKFVEFCENRKKKKID